VYPSPYAENRPDVKKGGGKSLQGKKRKLKRTGLPKAGRAIMWGGGGRGKKKKTVT